MARSSGQDSSRAVGLASRAVAAMGPSGGAARLPFRVAGAPSSGLAWFYEAEPKRRILEGRAYEIAKRIADIAFVLLSIPVVAPVILVCWLAVKVEAPRAQALFVQHRTGRNGRKFRMLKFRTMVPDAEEQKAALAAHNELQWPDFKIADDPRITPLGKWLRKSSLDELPQVFNVLRGDMSLVGPRPTSFGPETYQEWQKARLAVPPGLTGLWQIAGRGEMEFDERVRLDLAYIARRSLLLDARILLLTVGAVLRRKGAC
jgi:lipopolysaccharide/colanic/teichoic acid biosynthesis glycosyltransferase